MAYARFSTHATTPAVLSPIDETALLAQARALQRDAAAGRAQPLLTWLAAQLGSASDLSRNRCFALQALLLRTVE